MIYYIVKVSLINTNGLKIRKIAISNSFKYNLYMKQIILIFSFIFFVNCVSNTNKMEEKKIKSKLNEIKADNAPLNEDSINISNKDYLPISAQDYRKSKIEKRKKNIIENGDFYDYGVLSITYENENDFISILPYSVLMAEKYQNRDSYLDFYYSFIKIINNGDYKDEYFFNLDIESQRFLKHYLTKGADLGQSRCKKILMNLKKIANERKLEF